MFWPFHGRFHQLRPNKLIIPRRRELAIHLNFGLLTVLAIFLNNLVVNPLIRTLNRARINLF